MPSKKVSKLPKTPQSTFLEGIWSARDGFHVGLMWFSDVPVVFCGFSMVFLWFSAFRNWAKIPSES